jgi:antitoxin Xre/MbcA/ParS-like protein
VLQEELPSLASAIHESERALNGLYSDFFAHLWNADRDLAEQMLEVFGDPAPATRWFTSPSREFSGQTPLRMIADGHRQSLIGELARRTHRRAGVPLERRASFLGP